MWSAANLLTEPVVEDEMVFAGRAEWDGAVKEVDVLLTRSEDVLIGTAFLKVGYRVQLDYHKNSVRIERIASSGGRN